MPTTESADAANMNASAIVNLFGIGLHSWEQAMLWALGFAALAAVAVVVTTAAVVTLQKLEAEASERRFETYKVKAGKETAQANATAETAKKDAATANEGAEIARREAAEARLQLERLKSPRTLGPDRQAFVAAAVTAFKGQRYFAAITQGADDGIAFWESLYAALDKAGWVYVPLPPGSPGMGTPLAGVPIAAMPGVEIRFDPAERIKLESAALALGNALHVDGMVVAATVNPQTNPNDSDRDALLIVIGARVPPK